MPDWLEGGCHCRAVRYRFDLPVLGSSICHCASCRRTAGAQSVGWTSVPAAWFAWIAGEPASYASSPGVTRTHCRICGTSLTYQDRPESIDITLGSLDDPEALPPRGEIWLSHRLSWEAIDPRRTALERGPG